MTWHLGLMHLCNKGLATADSSGTGVVGFSVNRQMQVDTPTKQWSQTAIGQTGVNIRMAEDFQMVMHTNKDNCYHRHVIISV